MRNRKPTLSDVRDQILDYFAKFSHRPVLVGQIALLLNRPCEEVEGFLADLAHEGRIREQTADEARKTGYVLAYRFVQPLRKTA